MDDKQLEKCAKAIKNADYLAIREFQIQKIITLSGSDINSDELKGMLKLINYTDGLEAEYNKKLKAKGV